MISLRAVRAATLAICVAGIGGMIVTSIQGHNGAAITFGLITAVAIVCSMVATGVAADTARRLTDRGAEVEPGPGNGPEADFERGIANPQVERLAARVEDQIQALKATGVGEDALRALVGEAVRLGRTLGTTLGRTSS